MTTKNKIRIGAGVITAFLAYAYYVGEESSGGCFVLNDQRTGFPVLSFEVPGGWVAGGKVTWPSAADVRYYAWMTDGRMKVSLSSPMVLMSERWGAATIETAADITDPNRLAERFLESVCATYSLEDAQVVSATFEPDDSENQESFIQSRKSQGAQRGLRLSDWLFGLMTFKYRGTLDGKGHEVVFKAPYCCTEFDERSCSAELMFVFSACAEPDDLPEAERRMDAMAKGVLVNQTFIAYCNQAGNQFTMHFIANQDEMQRRFQQMHASLQEARDGVRDAHDRYAAASDKAFDRWCDFMRDEEKVVNPVTGRETFITTQYDNCRFGENGEVLYWNKDCNLPGGSKPGFDPNDNKYFQYTTWSEPQKVR